MQINQTSTASSTSTGSTANSGSSTGATAAGATTSDQMAKLSSNYTTFLKLLTSQMKYQDPMQPMDSSQFTSQLVQYSQVEQQISTNDKLDKLVSAQNSNQIQSALSFIGMDVEVNGNDLNLTKGNSAAFSYTLPDTAKSATIQITDAKGNLVRTITALTSPGRHDTSWDGKDASGNALASGDYTVSIGATGLDNKAMTVKSTVYGTVSGIESGTDGTMLVVNSQKIKLDDVVKAKTPTATTTTAAAA